ncbi:MAG: ATP-binding cassette domain-containing protein [Mariniphaga sp.]|nr:ATP-binding cassette domain-containing protein [Mariniphaga sp.]MDD4226856.1 ATP-binding cassette domain-containing protein [Mariniphaga sp.]
MVQSISILAGQNKDGNPEHFKRIDILRGEIVGVVGPTGSGKSALVEDIEQLAQSDTPTHRKILINNMIPEQDMRFNPKKKLVAQLSQNMNFIADMSVEEFLLLHSRCRNKNPNLIEKVIQHANMLTGEPIKKEMNLTVLSGGQSRSLMVADVAFISDSPVVLIDEIENAGIKKHEALQLLSGYGKIVLVVTHDPLLALLTRRRIIMENGGIKKIFDTTGEERLLCDMLYRIDKELFKVREMVRQGEEVSACFKWDGSYSNHVDFVVQN